MQTGKDADMHVARVFTHNLLARGGIIMRLCRIFTYKVQTRKDADMHVARVFTYNLRIIS